MQNISQPHMLHEFTGHLIPHSRNFHGNTCAHEMNVLSNATVLPCTAADVNDMLSVTLLVLENLILIVCD